MARGVPALVAIVGPTAAGKTGAAVSLAEKTGGEIISADSMQIWRGMDIGTAKPSPAERERATFHLVDVVDPGDDFSVAVFQQMAREAVAEIRACGKCAILAGGTGLYVRAVVDSLSFPPPPCAEVRDQLRAEAERAGSGELLERLRAVDPAAAARLSPADTRRIIRALEVFETTGRPISSFHEDDRRRRENTQWKLFGLEYSTEALAIRINERVDAMVREGLEQEVRALKALGLSRGSRAGRALGYSEMLACLDGECSLDEAIEAIKLNTRRFAKRQRTWFRADSRIAWIAVEGKSPDAIAEEILDRLEGSGSPFAG